MNGGTTTRTLTDLKATRKEIIEMSEYSYNVLWIVTYWDGTQEPTVTAFDNEEAAQRCYETFKLLHEGICLDQVPVYHDFKVQKGV